VRPASNAGCAAYPDWRAITTLGRWPRGTTQGRDLDCDGLTDQSDLGILLADWGCDDLVNSCVGDLNGDDKTDQAGLGILLADWGCGVP